jgi:hypothetical protein
MLVVSLMSVSAWAAPVAFQVADRTGLVLAGAVDPDRDSRWRFRTEAYGAWGLWATHRGQSVCLAVRPRPHGPLWAEWVGLVAPGSEDPMEPLRLVCIPEDGSGMSGMYEQFLFTVAWWNSADRAPSTVHLPDGPMPPEPW